jgi:3-oxoacyl-[acyl-carrier protein] reductase
VWRGGDHPQPPRPSGNDDWRRFLTSRLISLTKSLAVELAPHGILVNCVAPGWAVTDMTRDDLLGPRRESILQTIPLSRAATPEEIAGPVLFLASELATFITGEVLNVNGGAVLIG